jgi:hypothetical protein
MTEAIALAAALRKTGDAELGQLLKVRQLSSSNFRDFLDFADALTETKAVKSAVSALPRSQARALVALCAGVDPRDLDEAPVESLARQFLIFSDENESSTAPQHRVLDSVKNVVMAFGPIVDHVAVGEGPQVDRNLEAANRDAGVAAFETMQALTELHFDIDQRFVREVGKKGVGLADLKRLALHLRKSVDFARDIYRLAGQTKLVAIANGRWMLGIESDSWLELSPAQRFKSLASNWLQTLGEDSAKELLATSRVFPGHSLSALFRETYPFADEVVSSRISLLASVAHLIGLTAGESRTSWFELVLENRLDEASSQLAEYLPQSQERLIIQADLSLIAPGPLPTNLEIELRKFVETEQISMASTYRLSALSVSHGLETGLSEANIRKLLTKLSDKELPQPVDYLLREANERFGRLTVSNGPGEALSLVKSSDPILLTEILNETRLRPFGIRQNPDGHLFSRFEPEVIYFGLREAGFSAIRVDDAGKVISPRTVATRTSTISIISTAASDLERLREHDEKLGTDPGADDLVRQIEFALKNRSRLLITATDRSGKSHEFLLEPKNLSNGRLRGIDTKAEIERTLPLERVTSAVPVA